MSLVILFLPKDTPDFLGRSELRQHIEGLAQPQRPAGTGLT
jgi:hypothetical protein